MNKKNDDPSNCPVGDPADCPIPHERRADDPWRHSVTERIDAIDEQIAAIRKNTDEIVEFFQNGKGFFRVVKWVGLCAKWLTTVAAGLVLLWALAKFGVSSAIEDMRK